LVGLALEEREGGREEGRKKWVEGGRKEESIYVGQTLTVVSFAVTRKNKNVRNL
jgi:hypothetical protein